MVPLYTLLIVNAACTMILAVCCGMKNTPREMHEIARTFEMSAFARFRRVTIPMLLPYLMIGVIFALIQTWSVINFLYL